MISCYQVTKLISAQMDHPLSTEDKETLILHLLNCQQCNLFDRQMVIIVASVRELADETKVFKKFQGKYNHNLTKEKVLTVIHARNK